MCDQPFGAVPVRQAPLGVRSGVKCHFGAVATLGCCDEAGSEPDAAEDASASAAAGSMAASRRRASWGVGAVKVMWPTLRPGVTPALPYQCTDAPGVCGTKQAE